MPELLDRRRAAVVLIDVQEKLAGVMEDRDEVVAAAVMLVRAAGELDVPVVVTRQYPKGLGDTVPELVEAFGRLPEGLFVGPLDKTAFCCGGERTFADAWDGLGRDQALVCGMETHICVTQTALWLADRATVQVVADASCSRTERDERTALDRLRHSGVAVTTVEAALYELLERAGTPEFKAVLSLVKGS